MIIQYINYIVENNMWGLLFAVCVFLFVGCYKLPVRSIDEDDEDEDHVFSEEYDLFGYWFLVISTGGLWYIITQKQ